MHPLERFPSRADFLVEELTAELAGVPAGERVGTKEELRQRFGVSLVTLSQALRVLEGQGLVELRTGPGGGVFASRPTEHLLVSNIVASFRHGTPTAEETMAVREVLEPLVARLAARHRDQSDLSAFEELLASMEVSLDDPSEYLRANWQLHKRISEATGNRALVVVYGALVGFLEAELEGARPARTFLAQRRENLELHAQLVEAIAAGDAELAASLACHHAPVEPPGGRRKGHVAKATGSRASASARRLGGRRLAGKSSGLEVEALG